MLPVCAYTEDAALAAVLADKGIASVSDASGLEERLANKPPMFILDLRTRQVDDVIRQVINAGTLPERVVHIIGDEHRAFPRANWQHIIKTTPLSGLDVPRRGYLAVQHDVDDLAGRLEGIMFSLGGWMLLNKSLERVGADIPLDLCRTTLPEMAYRCVANHDLLLPLIRTCAVKNEAHVALISEEFFTFLHDTLAGIIGYHMDCYGLPHSKRAPDVRNAFERAQRVFTFARGEGTDALEPLGRVAASYSRQLLALLECVNDNQTFVYNRSSLNGGVILSNDVCLKPSKNPDGVLEIVQRLKQRAPGFPVVSGVPVALDVDGKPRFQYATLKGGWHNYFVAGGGQHIPVCMLGPCIEVMGDNKLKQSHLADLRWHLAPALAKHLALYEWALGPVKGDDNATHTLFQKTLMGLASLDATEKWLDAEKLIPVVGDVLRNLEARSEKIPFVRKEFVPYRDANLNNVILRTRFTLTPQALAKTAGCYLASLRLTLAYAEDITRQIMMPRDERKAMRGFLEQAFAVRMEGVRMLQVGNREMRLDDDALLSVVTRGIDATPREKAEALDDYLDTALDHVDIPAEVKPALFGESFVQTASDPRLHCDLLTDLNGENAAKRMMKWWVRSVRMPLAVYAAYSRQCKDCDGKTDAAGHPLTAPLQTFLTAYREEGTNLVDALKALEGALGPDYSGLRRHINWLGYIKSTSNAFYHHMMREMRSQDNLADSMRQLMIANQFLVDNAKMIPGQEKRGFSDERSARDYQNLNDALREYYTMRTMAVNNAEDGDRYQAVCCRTLYAINTHFLKGLALTEIDQARARRTS